MSGETTDTIDRETVEKWTDEEISGELRLLVQRINSILVIAKERELRIKLKLTPTAYKSRFYHQSIQITEILKPL